MLDFLWSFRKAGGLFLSTALVANLIFYILSLLRQRSSFKDTLYLHLYFLSSSLWILVNIPFSYSNDPQQLKTLANIAYIGALLTSWAIITITHRIHGSRVPKAFNIFTFGLLLITLLSGGPISYVLTDGKGFVLVPGPGLGQVLNSLFFFYTIVFLYLSYRIMITRGNTRLFIISAAYLALVVLLNLIAAVSTGNGLWWLGPSFIVIFSSFIYYLYVYRSGYSLSFYIIYVAAILLYGIIGGAIAEKLILSHLDKPSAYIFLGIWTLILVLILNLRSKGLTLTPYPTLITALEYLQNSLQEISLQQREKATNLIFSILTTLLNLKNIALLVFFRDLDTKIVITSNQTLYLTIQDPLDFKKDYPYLIYRFNPKGIAGHIEIYSKQPKEITIELDRYLTYVLSTLFIIYYLAFSRERLATYNQRLEQTVKLRTQELAEANLKLKRTLAKLEAMYQAVRESDQAKTMFISIASHQLRTPISIVKNYVDMILSGAAGPLTAEQQKFLLRIRQAMTRLANLITDILQSSRLERGKFKLVISTVNLASLVQEVFEQYKDLAARKRLEYKLEITSDVKNLTIQCDKDKLFEAFGNLIDNAIHYTQQGYVHVYLYQPNPQWVIYAVKDTGIGIPKNKIHQLFKKFVRLENARRVRPDGTGIGLYLVKRIVESHGGRVWVESEVGKGSTFYIALPTKLPEWVLKNATQINT